MADSHSNPATHEPIGVADESSQLTPNGQHAFRPWYFVQVYLSQKLESIVIPARATTHPYGQQPTAPQQSPPSTQQNSDVHRVYPATPQPCRAANLERDLESGAVRFDRMVGMISGLCHTKGVPREYPIGRSSISPSTKVPSETMAARSTSAGLGLEVMKGRILARDPDCTRGWLV